MKPTVIRITLGHQIKLMVCIIGLVAVFGGVNCQTQLRSLPSNCLTTEVNEQDVSRQIFSQYGNWQRPILNVSKPVVVSIALALSSINEVNEKKGFLRVTGYLSIRWFDQFRVWNTTFPLNCVSYVVVPGTNVWLPDIAAMNTEGRYSLTQQLNEKVRIYSDGYSVYSPGGTFTVFCFFDCTYFPFDEQACTLTFESWRYNDQSLVFNLYAPSVKLYMWSENTRWTLLNTSQEVFAVSYFDHDTSFERVEFYLHLKRKSSFYLSCIVIPCVVILLAQLATFSFPVDEVQKVFLLFACLLAYMAFESIVLGDLPRSIGKVPLLATYVESCMAIISVAIVGECLVFSSLRQAGEANKTANHSSSTTTQQRWRTFANIVDRITFIVHLAANITIPIVIFIIVPNFSMIAMKC